MASAIWTHQVLIDWHGDSSIGLSLEITHNCSVGTMDRELTSLIYLYELFVGKNLWQTKGGCLNKTLSISFKRVARRV